MKLKNWAGLLLSALVWFTLTNQALADYTLTLTADGSGTVVPNPTNSTSSYPPGVTVTITATPNAGWYFANWSGDTNGSVNPLNVQMNSSLNITGNFLPYPIYPLTLTTNGQGTIVLNPASATYQSNTVVTATATPASGWVFSGWTGSAAGSTNPLLFTMNSANSLTGNFAQLPAFDVPPVSVTNGLGSTASFFAHAVGTAPVVYQWYFNSAVLAGATNNMLVFTNSTLSEAGNYQITATNNYGSATSSVVALVLTNTSGSTNPVSVCNEADLSAAIANGGWISIGCNGTITLTNTITISNNVILDASYVSATISGGNTVRLFSVAPGASLTITNLTLADGMATNIYNNSLVNSVFAYGGAIYNNGGTVNLVNCTLTNNIALNNNFDESGEYSFMDPGGFALGGAIYNNGGVVTLSGSAIANNVASAGSAYILGTGDGGAIYSTNGSLTLAGCTLDVNLCTSSQPSAAAGGAICIASGSAYLTNCIFNTNSATEEYSDNANATTGAPGTGGAIALLGGNLAVSQCRFNNNIAHSGMALYAVGPSQGGAIYCATTMDVRNSTFMNNQAAYAGTSQSPADGQGGAVYNAGTATFNGCCLFSNYVCGTAGVQYDGGTSAAGNGHGAGIFNVAQLRATNCTIALNMAQAGVGFYFPYYYSAEANGNALGGGIYNCSNGVTLLMNDTIASNLCDATGGFTNGFSAGDQIANVSGGINLHSSLLAYAGTNGNAYGTITDGGYNISSDGSAALFGGTSYNYTDPQLTALANNGGPTLTMYLLASSPAIGYGDSSGAPNIDQRGYVRPFNGGYDVGAVQYGSYPEPPPPSLSFMRSAPNLLLNFTAEPSITYHLQWSTNLASWSDMEIFGAFSSPSNITCTISPQGTAMKFFRVWYQ